MSAAAAAVRCPLGHRCESCGRDRAELAVTEIETAAGIVCVTLCPGCARAIAGGCDLPVTAGTASRLAEQHRTHHRPARPASAP